jgi:Fur family peroxide stress response transcriptional regulator
MQTALEFRELCRRHHLAGTHQRQVIYQTLMTLDEHPSPEKVYEKVRRRIPAISLATVYKNLRIFLENGIVREVSLHHGSLRVETRQQPHHHLVCMKCRSITDLEEDALTPVRLRHKLPRGFRVERFAVDILGLCERCAGAGKTSARKIS